MSELEHYDMELYEMEKRIRRLAISCDFELTDTNIVAFIRGNDEMCTGGEEHTRKELRGLLMLKYNIEEHCIQTVGAEKCLQVVSAMNKQLRREGFQVEEEGA
jgi:hypothetical protein